MLPLQIAEYLAQQATELFPKKIALIAVYGSYSFGTPNENSDLDMYAIVDNEDDTTLPWSFIFNGVPIDLWKMNWTKARNLAAGLPNKKIWSVAASIFINNKILYIRSEQDRIQFKQIQKTIVRTEKEHLDTAIEIFSQLFSYVNMMKQANRSLDVLSARWASWNLINSVVEILARINGQYLTQNWGSNISQIHKFEIKPKGISDTIHVLATSPEIDVLITKSNELIEAIEQIIRDKQQTIEILKYNLPEKLPDDFISIKEYIGKIKAAIKEKDIIKASYAATELQIWLAELMEKEKMSKHINCNQINLYKEFCSQYQKLGFPSLDKAISTQNFQQINHEIYLLEKLLNQFSHQQGIKLRYFSQLDEIQKYIERNKE